MSEGLTEDEKLTFAGLVRALVRLDRSFSNAERAAIEDIGLELFRESPKTYKTSLKHKRDPEDEAPRPEDAVWDWIEVAGELVPDDDAARKAALATTRRSAQLEIYDALFAIASSDSVNEGEETLLDFLRKAWSIEQRNDSSKAGGDDAEP